MEPTAGEVAGVLKGPLVSAPSACGEGPLERRSACEEGPRGSRSASKEGPQGSWSASKEGPQESRSASKEGPQESRSMLPGLSDSSSPAATVGCPRSSTKKKINKGTLS
jgi:hypothetical protein